MSSHKKPASTIMRGLEEIVTIDTESVFPPSKPDTLFNYIGLENIEAGSGRLVDFVPKLGDEIRSNKFRFDSKHVLLGKLRPYLNKVFLPDFEGICSTDILPLRPNLSIIDRTYLSICLMSPDFVEYSRSLMEGTKMPRLRTNDLKRFRIPVPPLNEQRRIVARIEELTKRVQEAKRLQQEASEEAETIMPSYISRIFSVNEKNSDWQEMSFNKAIRRVQSYGGKLKSVEYEEIGDIPIVDQGNMLIAGYTNRKEHKFQGPLPVVVFGDHTKNVKYIDFDFVVGADGVVLLQPCSFITAKYLYYWLKSCSIHNLGYSRHFKLLKEKKIRYPKDIREQEKITKKLDELASKTKILKDEIISVGMELGRFNAALLSKAFRGEL